MAKRPRTIKVLGQSFKVSFTEPEEGTAGFMDSVGRRIVVGTNQCAFDMRDTLLHEAFHAILFRQGREFGGKTEETYVRALATGALQLLQDNPELVRWLLSDQPHVQST